jgi:tRNA threonylcarbamoyladenosine biosynthesis protein TsaE
MSISRSAEETEALAAVRSTQAAPRLVVGLIGDLGAGKTHWARGFARGLGFPGRVHSPTFALLHEYAGRWPIYHLDLYRLESPEQVFGAGLEEYLPSRDGVTIVEWIERWLPALAVAGSESGRAGGYPPALWVVRFELTGPNERHLVHEDLSH